MMNRIFKDALEFFAVLSVLFVVISFASHFLMKRMRLDDIFLSLQKKNQGLSNAAAAMFGAITPFCVCTTIPIFTGMIRMGIETNAAMSFLFSSPLISISGAVLIFYLFGIKFSVYYIVSTLIFSTLGGLFVYWLKMDGEVNEKMRDSPPAGNAVSHKESGQFALQLFKNLFIPLLFGALIAGLIHNYVPVRFIETINQYPRWATIPLAALFGFPIYSNIIVLAPICLSLVDKGMNPGAVMAFLMSGAGISLPTALVLHTLLKRKLFIYYLSYTFVSYCLIGLVFSFIG